MTVKFSPFGESLEFNVAALIGRRAVEENAGIQCREQWREVTVSRSTRESGSESPRCDKLRSWIRRTLGEQEHSHVLEQAYEYMTKVAGSRVNTARSCVPQRFAKTCLLRRQLVPTGTPHRCLVQGDAWKALRLASS